MNRVTADSNIFISAFLRGGKPLQLLELARAGQIELAITEDILRETGRVLGSKFHVSSEDVQQFRDEIIGFAKSRPPDLSIDLKPMYPIECGAARGILGTDYSNSRGRCWVEMPALSSRVSSVSPSRYCMTRYATACPEPACPELVEAVEGFCSPTSNSVQMCG